MKTVPWSYVKSWTCFECGECCKRYVVNLTIKEWLNIVHIFGVEVTIPSATGFYLKRRTDGRCVFIYNASDRWLCGLQGTKPRSCKLWPFKMFRSPKLGYEDEASFTYRGRKFFIYVDPACRGIRWGSPSADFVSKTLPEFVDVSLGLCEKQRYSTSSFPSYIRVLA